jgi:uncharacterized membrane protein
MTNEPPGAPLDSPPRSPLDALPSKDGFRLRGLDMTRTETFTDAAFAFTVTLLVVSIDAMPSTYDELVAAMQGIPAFAISFGLVLMFWHAHWTWSRRYGLEDMPTILLSASLVFVVLCYVYPLKFVSSGIVAWLSGFSLGGIGRMTGSQLHGMFAIYAVGFIAMCLIIVLLNVHAYRRRAQLELDEVEQLDTRAEMGAWLLVASAGVLSLVLALATAPRQIMLPGWAYMILPVMMPIYGVKMGRRRRRLREAA